MSRVFDTPPAGVYDFYFYKVRRDGASRPTGYPEAAGQPGKHGPHDAANLCGGRFHIGPVCGGVNACERDKSRPYE